METDTTPEATQSVLGDVDDLLMTDPTPADPDAIPGPGTVPDPADEPPAEDPAEDQPEVDPEADPAE